MDMKKGNGLTNLLEHLLSLWANMECPGDLLPAQQKHTS